MEWVKILLHRYFIYKRNKWEICKRAHYSSALPMPWKIVNIDINSTCQKNRPFVQWQWSRCIHDRVHMKRIRPRVRENLSRKSPKVSINDAHNLILFVFNMKVPGPKTFINNGNLLLMHEEVVASTPKMPVGSDFAYQFVLWRVDFNMRIQKKLERSFNFQNYVSIAIEYVGVERPTGVKELTDEWG